MNFMTLNPCQKYSNLQQPGANKRRTTLCYGHVTIRDTVQKKEIDRTFKKVKR